MESNTNTGLSIARLRATAVSVVEAKLSADLAGPVAWQYRIPPRTAGSLSGWRTCDDLTHARLCQQKGCEMRALGVIPHMSIVPD